MGNQRFFSLIRSAAIEKWGALQGALHLMVMILTSDLISHWK